MGAKVIILVKSLIPNLLRACATVHYIIIVHTATWKDLTKWNEENTIIDWNNYVGRIVKHVFPMLSRLRREGQRMKKITGYTMHYFISLYQV